MSRIELFELLHQGLVEMGQPLERQMETQLIRYIELIAQWNRVFNLTAIRDLDTMVIRHLLDSLSILPYLKGRHIIDVGTGAGLPGIPLAIVLPDRQFVLLDSNQKKTRFLQQTCYHMRLNRNVHIVHKRAEEYTPEQLFDCVISRAFSTTRDFLTLSEHLIKPGGQILAMKGVYPLTELQEVNKPFRVVDVHPLKVPQLNAERHVVDLIYEPVTEMETVNG
jgi:16S rRNA (guanine527-N7)-methyltransferase